MSADWVTQLPPLNAGLNGLSTCLLLGAGYAVKIKKDEQLHKKLIFSALIVSTVFLAIYFFYHGQVGHVEFKGEGWSRTLYYLILFPHILLAGALLPLIFFTARAAMRDQRERHKKWVRWTYPIWLYVSFSGVLIYWMVFHLYA